MRKCRIVILLTVLMVLAAGCDSTGERPKPEVALTEVEEKNIQYEASRNKEDAETTKVPSGQPDGQSSKIPVVLENLNAHGSLLSQTFYQAGNVNNHMRCYVCSGEDGDEFRSGRLGISITKMIPYYSDTTEDRKLIIYAETEVETIPGQNTYQAELAVTCYQNWERFFENTYGVTVSLPEKGDTEGAVTLVGLNRAPDVGPEDSRDVSKEIGSLAGAYYRMDSDQDLFVRYLCKAELCAYPTEVLRLMRNTIYAAHGRTFQNPALAEYMEGKPWYRKMTGPKDFSEDVLSDVERKNIALLKELEEIPYGQRCMMYGEDYSVEGFANAPYLPFLSQNKEIGLDADFTQAKDCGAYYSVPGKLYLPITLTRKQWEHVQAGETEELCVNELTGETRILELDDGKNYCLYERGARPDSWSPSDIYICYQYDTGLYELQVLSDDTMMKPVYEGDLYFLKGAVRGGMVSLTTASELQEEITMQTQEVYANCLYHNGRGYFTAVYALGD